jgi:hypothetical protein
MRALHLVPGRITLGIGPGGRQRGNREGKGGGENL